MSTKSSSLSRFAVGQAGLAALAFVGALAVVPAVADPADALIESLTSNSQRAELMHYVRAGQVIRLSPNQTIVLSYRASCVRESITGGTVTIGTEQSDVRSGEVMSTKGQCGIGKIELKDGEIDTGGRAYRKVQ